MKIYELTLKPISAFGTPLKGDTIFGQFCWEYAEFYKNNGKSLEQILLTYNESPFVIFSSAIPKYLLNSKYIYLFKVPTVPRLFLPQEVQKYKKQDNVFMIIEEGSNISNLKNITIQTISLFELQNTSYPKLDKSIANKIILNLAQSHNTINRLEGKTTKERFAPYSVDQIAYNPLIELAIFAYINEDVINIETVKEIFIKIGLTGFGKDASTGLGRFQFISAKEIDLKKMGCSNPNACYTLSPCLPEKNTFDYTHSYFTPFIRFGRHGNKLAKSSNPFKNPIIMMDEGAVLKLKDNSILNKPYIGTPIHDVSKIEPKTVVQGYSLYIPVRLEEN